MFCRTPIVVGVENQIVSIGFLRLRNSHLGRSRSRSLLGVQVEPSRVLHRVYSHVGWL